MNLILLDQPPQAKDDAKGVDSVTRDAQEMVFTLDEKDARAKHIIKQLKKAVGDRLRVGLFPNGPMGQATIIIVPSTTNNHNQIHLKVDTNSLQPPPTRPLVRVLLGVAYPKVIKALWPVLTSLGVDHIFYAKAALTEPDFLETSSLTPAVYEPLLREGLAQGEDTRPPKVTILPKQVSILNVLSSSSLSTPNATSSTDSALSTFEALTKDCCKIVLHINDKHIETPTSIRQCYLQQSLNNKGILLAIGPERGWTDAEANAFGAANFAYASLGDPILRTDTAVVAAVALARDVLLDTGYQQSGKKRPLRNEGS